MKLINMNLKKTGIFNSILIVIALVLRVKNIVGMSTVRIIDTIVCAIGLIFGLLYCLNGYKKDAAKYYRVFMYLYALDSLISFIVSLTLYEFNSMAMINIIHGINISILVCACLLAFVKDFGEYNTKTVACIILVLNAIKFFSDLTSGALEVINYASLTNLVQAIIVYVLVSHKYIDKESRGVK